MHLIDGDPFDIEGAANEEITFVMTDGTVDQVITVLDGVDQVLKKGEKKTFTVTPGPKRRLLVTYIFKAQSGEFYESRVTGSAGGDVSIDKAKQVPNQADHSRSYSFKVA